MANYTAAVTAALVMALVTGCASTPEDDSVIVKNDAVDDYIIVAELKEIYAIRTRDQLHYKLVTENYIIVSDRKNSYLLAFKRRCRELRDIEVTPDIRRERNTLRARFDTYRGCPIRSLYELNRGQADELLALGEEPGH